MINAVAAAALAMSTVVVPQADVPQADVPPPGAVTIDLVTVNGSGCPPGTASVAPTPDNTAFHALYSDYIALVGVGARPTDFRKNCQLTLRVNAPQGYTYGISQVDYRGYIQLAGGATGTQKANYYFQGTVPTEYRSHTWRGPVSDNWQSSDEGLAVVYRPCGEPRNLNINTELRVSAGTSDPKTTTSFMAMDSTDAYVATVYQFAWKRCE
ncbi:DUF4360 domain-containing protein [Lentzea kentuckyensis]|uniref:DUF4360 domain-containing protein n=1 Tax=Lentzea kentuckyensis TaxID=360086 RepID=UPI000A3D5935|nr:DUF4360 domain-containing protein [Lentzea kentuckyensis]